MFLTALSMLLLLIQGEYSDYDFAADQADYAHYAAAHLQQGQHPDSNGQYTASSHESYDDPYSAAELSGECAVLAASDSICVIRCM
jgi:hypothetical protein